jgi:chromosome partitioning protein
MSRKTRNTASKTPPPVVRRAGATSGRPVSPSSTPKARIIAVCNQKGGCGKTTSVINIAAGLASLGKRVLVVDLDSQCNATTGLCGVDGQPDAHALSTFDLMVRSSEVRPKDTVLKTPYKNLFIIPGSIILSEFESRVAAEIGRENKLKKALAGLRGEFDFILLDTPPSLGLISVNALNAATEVQIAMQAHPFALDGLNLLLETIELVQAELNPSLSISGVYITMFDARTRISQEILQSVAANPGLRRIIFSTLIRQNIKVTEASQAKVPVMYYDADCTGTADYLGLSKEIARQRLGAQAMPATKRKATTSKTAQKSKSTAKECR